VPSVDDFAKKFREQAEALDRIIAEAKRVKAELEHQLHEIRQAGRPAPTLERRRAVRKVK